MTVHDDEVIDGCRAESGGTTWGSKLAEAQTRAMLSLFFLSNAYCGR